MTTLSLFTQASIRVTFLEFHRDKAGLNVDKAHSSWSLSCREWLPLRGNFRFAYRNLLLAALVLLMQLTRIFHKVFMLVFY